MNTAMPKFYTKADSLDICGDSPFTICFGPSEKINGANAVSAFPARITRAFKSDGSVEFRILDWMPVYSEEEMKEYNALLIGSGDVENVTNYSIVNTFMIGQIAELGTRYIWFYNHVAIPLSKKGFITEADAYFYDPSIGREKKETLEISEDNLDRLACQAWQLPLYSNAKGGTVAKKGHTMRGYLPGKKTSSEMYYCSAGYYNDNWIYAPKEYILAYAELFDYEPVFRVCAADGITSCDEIVPFKEIPF